MKTFVHKVKSLHLYHLIASSMNKVFLVLFADIIWHEDRNSKKYACYVISETNLQLCPVSSG